MQPMLVSKLFGLVQASLNDICVQSQVQKTVDGTERSQYHVGAAPPEVSLPIFFVCKSNIAELYSAA